MHDYSLVRMDTPGELLQHAGRWNDLWERSTCTNPLATAESIAIWTERFAPDVPFHALAVESNGTFHAAIALVETRKAKFVRAGILPSNPWAHCGALLFDETEIQSDASPTGSAKKIAERLIDGLRRLPPDILWLDFVRFDDPAWKFFRETLAELRIPSQWLQRHATLIAALDRENGASESLWNKREIGNIRRRLKKYGDPDTWKFRSLDTAPEILAQLPECFVLEDAGWKGDRGGSILRQGTDGYYERLVETLAPRGGVRLFTLRKEDRLLFFQLCFFGKGTIYGQKIAFSEADRDLAPGQVAQLLTMERLLDDPLVERFDFVGAEMPHQKLWGSEPTPVGQVVLPCRSLRGRAFFMLYDTVMPRLRKGK